MQRMLQLGVTDAPTASPTPTASSFDPISNTIVTIATSLGIAIILQLQ